MAAELSSRDAGKPMDPAAIEEVAQLVSGLEDPGATQETRRLNGLHTFHVAADRRDPFVVADRSHRR